MQSFNEFLLIENFKNLFLADKAERKIYADQVWDVLQMSYAKIGGIKGHGFNSKEDMIKTIPFWKLFVKNDEVIALIMYKDKGGRKSVAAGTNRTSAGVKALLNMLKQEFGRSFGEKSGPLLAFVKDAYPALVKKFAIPAVEVAKLIGKTDKEVQLIPGEKFLYLRKLKDGWHEKMLIGTPGKKIIQ